MVMLLQVNLVLFTRSILIPSSARRTLLVSALAAAPLGVYSLLQETPRLAVWKLMWLLAAIAVATAGSAVIYGLRREVRHARQLGSTPSRGSSARAAWASSTGPATPCCAARPR